MNSLRLLYAAVPAFLLVACGVMDVADLASTKPGAREIRQAPAMRPDPMVGVPAGTELTLALDGMLSSRISRAGDAFSATVIEPIVQDGREVIPAGSTIEGKVTEATSARGGARRATLAVSVEALRLATGYQTDIVGRFQEVRILGKDTRGMVVGAIVGGGVGSLAMTNPSGAQVIVPADTPFRFKLEQPVQVPQAASTI